MEYTTLDEIDSWPSNKLNTWKLPHEHPYYLGPKEVFLKHINCLVDSKVASKPPPCTSLTKSFRIGPLGIHSLLPLNKKPSWRV